jgi:hypothetical protein
MGRFASGGFFARLALGLAAAGVASLRFDFRAHGVSEGRQEDVTLAGIVNDILAAVGQLTLNSTAVTPLALTTTPPAAATPRPAPHRAQADRRTHQPNPFPLFWVPLIERLSNGQFMTHMGKIVKCHDAAPLAQHASDQICRCGCGANASPGRQFVSQAHYNVWLSQKRYIGRNRRPEAK